jgi:hypothetical protein
MRAMRKRYLPRSAPLIADQTRVYAVRAARTAMSTSSALASETSESTSSVAGLTVLNGVPPVASTNSPPMNSP